MIKYGSVAGLVGAGAGAVTGVVVGVPAASAAGVGAVAGVVGFAAAKRVYAFFHPPKDDFIDHDIEAAGKAFCAFQNQNGRK